MFRRSRATHVALGLAILAILVATLSPVDESASGELPLCLLCGERGAADAVANVLLFVPLGVALCLIRLAALRALFAAAGLSLFVEIAQFAIVPGRDASLSDLLFNTLGAASGYAAVRTIWRWLHLPPTPASRLSLLAAALAVTVVALTGILLSPSLPPSAYDGQWTESPGNLEQYEGRIVEASLDSASVPARPLEHSEDIRDLLLAGAPLDIRLIAGPPTRSLGQLFAIVEHGSQSEVLLLGIHGDDLVFRYRTRANDLRLDAGALRVSDALAGVSPGAAVRLIMWAERDGYCASVNEIRSCRLAFSAANGWMILFSVDSWPGWLRTTLGTGWLAALVIPVGIWLRQRWSSFLALLLLSIGLTILPPAVGLSRPSAIESAGALFGLMLGMALSTLISRSIGPSPSPAGARPIA